MVYPRLRPIYLGKADLTDTYLQMWVRLEDTLSVEFLILRKILPTNS